MKYEKLIMEAFDRLGFTPRPGQAPAVNEILTAFLDEGAENFILSASTGTGKSIIGAVTAEALTAAKGVLGDGPKSSISLVSTNVLAKQYDSTFASLAKDKKYIMIKGANNYNCGVLTTPEKAETAESCALFSMKSAGDEFSGVIAEHCTKCEYQKVRGMKNSVRHLTTNYSYFFVDRMYTHQFESRDLLVWDEAHLINDLFSEHNAIHFSQSRLQQAAKEIAETVSLTDINISKLLTKIAKDCSIKDKINETNYQTYLRSLLEIYEYAVTKGKAEAASAMRSRNMGRYTKLSKFVKRFEGLYCKITDLFEFNYEHVLDYQEKECAVTIKPIFVGTMTKNLQAATHNLFMSATISKEYMVKTLHLDPEKTKFVKLDPTFPKENKEVVFFDPLSLSYASLQKEEVVKQLRKNVAKVVKKHCADGDRGIILTPSFKLQNELVYELQPLIKDKKLKLFEHKQGERLEVFLTAFKEYKGEIPAVLISPSIYEGIDLPGDLSRFQILVKAPFPSLGDKRMKFILDHHPDLYNSITIMKMTQGFGRSVRSDTDHATSYCMDSQGQRLFTSPANIWKNEFHLRFTKFI